MHEGHGQGQRSVVHGPGAVAVAVPVDRPREVWWLRQVAWLGAAQGTEAVWGPVASCGTGVMQGPPT